MFWHSPQGICWKKTLSSKNRNLQGIPRPLPWLIIAVSTVSFRRCSGHTALHTHSVNILSQNRTRQLRGLIEKQLFERPAIPIRSSSLSCAVRIRSAKYLPGLKRQAQQQNGKSSDPHTRTHIHVGDFGAYRIGGYCVPELSLNLHIHIHIRLAGTHCSGSLHEERQRWVGLQISPWNTDPC